MKQTNFEENANEKLTEEKRQAWKFKAKKYQSSMSY